MTTNAYAQNNTERLIHIIETTDSTETALGSIQTLLTGIGNDIMEALSALAGDIDMISNDMTTEFNDVDTAISNVDTKVSALDSKIMMLDTALMDVDTDVSSIVGQITALDQRIQQVDTNYKETVDNITVMLPAIKTAVDDLAECDVCDTMDALLESIRTNDAKINELTTSAATISAQLATIQEELDIVATTTATVVTTPARAPLTGPVAGSATLEITPYDIARNVKGEGASAEAEVAFTFMCEEEIYINNLMREGPESNDPLTDFSDPNNDEVTVSISGPITDDQYHSKFKYATTNPTTLDKVITPDNVPLLANDTLTITLTADSGALDNSVITADSIYANQSKTATLTIRDLSDNLDKPFHDKAYDEGSDPKVLHQSDDDTVISAQTVGPIIYKLKVSWISDAMDPKCAFMRTDATTDTMTAYVNLPSDSVDGAVLATPTKTLDCNEIDTTIVSIDPIMTGDLKQATTLKFTVDGDVKAIFSFDSDGNHSLAKGYEDALPLDLGDENLMIEASISQQTTLLLLVDYQSVDGNECSVQGSS